MSNETEFVNGLIVKAPNDNAPEYVKAKLSIKREELRAWLDTKQDDWINLDIKVSSGGKWYAAVDNWRPNTNGTPRNNAPRPQRRDPRDFHNDPDGMADEIPFATSRSRW
jgi:hypothetical protein